MQFLDVSMHVRTFINVSEPKLRMMKMAFVLTLKPRFTHILCKYFIIL